MRISCRQNESTVSRCDVADGKLLISILFRESMDKVATPLSITNEGLRQNILETATSERAAGRPVSLVSS